MIKIDKIYRNHMFERLSSLSVVEVVGYLWIKIVSKRKTDTQ